MEEEDTKTEFVGDCKNKTITGLGDPGALLFLALPSESSRSTCDVADSARQAWDARFAPGASRRHRGFPRRGPGGRGGAAA